MGTTCANLPHKWTSSPTSVRESPPPMSRRWPSSRSSATGPSQPSFAWPSRIEWPGPRKTTASPSRARPSAPPRRNERRAMHCQQANAPTGESPLDLALGDDADRLRRFDGGDKSALRSLVPWAQDEREAEVEAQRLSRRVQRIRHGEARRAWFSAASARRTRVPCRTARPREHRPRSCRRAPTRSSARAGDPPGGEPPGDLAGPQRRATGLA